MNCGRTGHSASDCTVSENVRPEEQVKAAWYTPTSISMEERDADDQVRVISIAEEGGLRVQ